MTRRSKLPTRASHAHGPRPTAHARVGFTLLELMIVMVLLSVFASGVYEVVIVSLRAAYSADRREDVRLQLAKALDRLSREASAAYNVDNSLVQRFQFDARVVDGNGDGDADNLTNINWRVQSGDLERVQGGTTMVLVPDLDSLTFTYLDSSGNATTNANNVRVMQVTASVTKGSETVTMATSAYLRNL